MTYRMRLEPEATVWRALVAHARGRGLVHGQLAVDMLTAWPSNRSVADAATLLADMVRAGVLRPIAKDVAGASHSVRAFRGLQNLRKLTTSHYPDVRVWLDGVPSASADAHLWTFEAVD